MNPYQPLTCPQCSAALPSFDETLICPYCGTRLMRPKAETPPGGPGAKNCPGAKDSPRATDGPLTSQAVRGMRFTPFTCTDSAGTGMEAFRMLMPAGWQAQGGVYWPNTNPGMPALLAFRLFDPHSPTAFEVFPNQPFYWCSNPMTMMTFPVGSYYFGNEVRPPMGAQQALRELLVPRFRRLPGIEIVSQEPLPDLAEKMKALSPGEQGGMGSADGARLRLRYTVEAQPVEEELYAVIEYSRQAMPSMMGMFEMVFWVADYLFSFRARQGQLDGLRDLFQTILTSFQLNRQWFARVMQISQYMIQNQIQQINNIGQLSRYISQTQNQVSDMITSSYYERQQVMDRLSDRFSQAIRGVDAYYDPNRDANVELPTGYNHAWSNALGEYIVSEDPFYNPNQSSEQNWVQMERRE